MVNLVHLWLVKVAHGLNLGWRGFQKCTLFHIWALFKPLLIYLGDSMLTLHELFATKEIDYTIFESTLIFKHGKSWGFSVLPASTAIHIISNKIIWVFWVVQFRLTFFSIWDSWIKTTWKVMVFEDTLFIWRPESTLGSTCLRSNLIWIVLLIFHLIVKLVWLLNRRICHVGCSNDMWWLTLSRQSSHPLDNYSVLGPILLILRGVRVGF